MILRPVIISIPVESGLSGRERVQRQRDFARRALLRSAQHSGAPQEGWTQDANRVPIPNAGWQWSISHKPRLAAAVVSRRPVGIDVEERRPRRNDMLWDRVISSHEWHIAGRRDWEMFFRLWTSKEATLKANYTGIAGLVHCRLAHRQDDDHFTMAFEDAHWEVQLFVHFDHVLALTAGVNDAHWAVMSGD